MNYYIAFINEEGQDWCVLETTDKAYAYKVYDELSAPWGYDKELRQTESDVDTHLSYEVLKKNDEDMTGMDNSNKYPVLCGFVWCHGFRDFSVFETDAISREDRAKIEEILAQYDTTGTSLSDCYDSKFSDALSERYVDPILEAAAANVKEEG